VEAVSEEAKEGETPANEPGSAVDASLPPLVVHEEPRSRAFKIERIREKRKLVLFKRFRGRWPTAMRIDALSVLSATLGFMSLGMPWIREVSPSHEHYYTLWHYLIYDPDMGVLVFGLATTGMLMGSVFAMFSRIGGVVQLAGLVSFVTISMSSDSSYAYGLCFGAVACACGVASIIARRSFPIPDRLRTIVRSPDGGAVTVNLLSLAGGALGVLSLFLVWFHGEWTYGYAGRVWTVDYKDYTLLQFAGTYFASPLTTAAAICFASGSILSILSPLGFVGQLVGVSAFIYAMRDNAAYFGNFESSGQYGYSMSSESTYAIGLYLGVACLLMVLGSVILRWRLRLSGGAASAIVSWPARHSTLAPSPTPSGGVIVAWHGLVPALTQTIKTMFVVVVVLTIAVAAAGLSYALPWSDIEIRITNSDNNSRVHVSIYVDGEMKDVDFISSFTYYVKSFDVRAGTVKIAFDYGFPDDSHGTDIDGTIDWSTYVKIKPLRLSIVTVSLGTDYTLAPVVTMEASDYDNGWKLSETSVNDNVTNFPNIYWSGIRLVLHDGTNHVAWQPLTSDLDNGTLTDYAFTPRLLGNITVTCSIVDLLGNGCLDVGDFVLMTSGTNYTFSSSVTYTLYLLYEPTESLASEVVLQGRY
jgi:hypothetical protein